MIAIILLAVLGQDGGKLSEAEAYRAERIEAFCGNAPAVVSDEVACPPIRYNVALLGRQCEEERRGGKVMFHACATFDGIRADLDRCLARNRQASEASARWTADCRSRTSAQVDADLQRKREEAAERIAQQEKTAATQRAAAEAQAAAERSVIEDRSDPKTWSKTGWQTFRWGMRKGDLVDRLWHPAKSEIGCEEYHYDPSADRLFCTGSAKMLNRGVELSFGLSGGRLVRIEITPDRLDGEGDEPAVRRAETDWFMAAATALKGKYGKPVEERGLDKSLGAVLAGAGVPLIVWKKGDLRIELVLGSDTEEGIHDYGSGREHAWKGSRLAASLRYIDDAAAKRQREAQAKEDRQKL